MKWFDKAIAWVTYNAECEEVTALITENKCLRSELEAAKEKLDSKALALESADYASRQLTRNLRDSEEQRELDSGRHRRETHKLNEELKFYRMLAYVVFILGAGALALAINVYWSNL